MTTGKFPLTLPCMRKICSMVMMIALLAVSSVPLLPAGMNGNAQAATYCPLCHMANHMTMTHMDHARQTMTPTMRHARIEYCGHHDINALPHLLAPHVVSLAGFDAYLIMDAVDASVPTLKPRLLPFPVPPPKSS